MPRPLWHHDPHVGATNDVRAVCRHPGDRDDDRHIRAGGGESAAMLRERWRCAVQKWRESRLEAAIAITHAGLIRMALAEQGLITEEARWNHPIAHGQIYEIEI